MAAPALKFVPQTIEDLAAIPEEDRFHEILDGVIEQKALPTPKHGLTQGSVMIGLSAFRRRQGGPHQPGGWWFASEVEIELAPHQVVRPDVAGWRRERVPGPPDGWPCRERPDWVAEILSRGSERRDLLTKFRLYHAFEIPHYWILDPEAGLLRVHRWQPQGYLSVLDARRGQTVRAEPFELIELSVGGLFDDEDEAVEGT